MRKICLIALIAVIASSLLGAAAVPIQNFRDQEEWVKHPGLLPVTEESTTFDISADFGNSIDDGFRFLSDPVGTLQEAAVAFGDAIVSMDDAEILENYQSLSESFTFDPGFPGRGNTDEETVYFVREYFRDGGRFDLLDPANRARGVASALRNGLAPYSGNILPGAMYIDLRMRGGEVHSGFGWDWNVNFNYDGSKSLVDRFGGRMSVDARINIGYAFHMISERFSVGVVAQPQLRFQMDIPNQGYLLARLEDEPLSIFGENLNFGTAIAFNFGAMYRHNENLAFELDVRNAPYFQSFFYISTDDIANEDVKFRRDKNIYFVPPDVALTAFWDWNKYHIEVELSDIVNQLIWENEYPELSFNYYSVPKIRFGYDIIDEMTIGAKLQYNTFAVDFGWKGLTAEISTKLDIFAIGMKVGYRF